MMNTLKIVLLVLVITSIPFTYTYSLEKLSELDMKKSTAQAGVSIAVDGALFYNYQDSIRLTNLLELDSYIEFAGMHSVTTVNCGVSDVDGDGSIGHFTLDMFTETDELSPVYGQAFLNINAGDFDVDMTTTIDTVNFCGTDIGSVKINNNTIQSFHFYTGAHDCGIDLEFGFQSRIGSVDYQYNDTPTGPETGNLAATGIAFANSFTGDESDPSTWVPVGEFTIGDIENGKPVVIDIGGSAGDPNPNTHISLRAGAMEGSFRVENINFGGNDVGQVIMDGIDIQRFDIEFPGRGLGNP